MITPEQIDFNLAINEVNTEVAQEDGWRADSAVLAVQCDLVYITDAEGEFVCLADRKMAEWICRELNQTCDICLTRCGKLSGEECRALKPGKKGK